jgi:hypothetical protein
MVQKQSEQGAPTRDGSLGSQKESIMRSQVQPNFHFFGGREDTAFAGIRHDLARAIEGGVVLRSREVSSCLRSCSVRNREAMAQQFVGRRSSRQT